MSNPGGRPTTGGNGSARPPTLENFAPQNKRGRPRSTGSHLCDRCQQHVAKIPVRWPDGAACGACFAQATHTYGTCPDCREQRMLPGRAPSTNEPICRDCAGIATDLTCTRCEREAERFRAGLCVRCALADDLTAVLKPGDDLRLHRLMGLLTETGRPESIYTYMRPGTKARDLLEAIGNRTLALTHEAFDALPRSTAAEHLRALLVHHRMMAARGNENLARFEQWIAARIDALPDDGTSRIIERFATWHHLKRVRARATDPETNLETVTHAAKQDITEAGKFLIWLRQHHNAGADHLRQSHVDDYLSSGPSTRKTVRNFVRWLNEQQSGRTSELDARGPRRRTHVRLHHAEEARADQGTGIGWPTGRPSTLSRPPNRRNPLGIYFSRPSVELDYESGCARCRRNGSNFMDSSRLHPRRTTCP
ncbi:hypothetical protein [Sinomonas sp. P47F7]|uniref:hypothetical protein n=1 Tax=Sinomonas sp. P47F7 TaxID=3410987 RepID=UPI003BF4FD42